MDHNGFHFTSIKEEQSGVSDKVMQFQLMHSRLTVAKDTVIELETSTRCIPVVDLVSSEDDEDEDIYRNNGGDSDHDSASLPSISPTDPSESDSSDQVGHLAEDYDDPDYRIRQRNFTMFNGRRRDHRKRRDSRSQSSEPSPKRSCKLSSRPSRRARSQSLSNVRRFHQDSPRLERRARSTVRRRSVSRESTRPLPAYVQCHKCPAKFTSSTGCNMHLLQHGRQLKYECEFCDYTSHRVDYISRHIALHILSQAANGPNESPGDGRKITNEEWQVLLKGNPEFTYKRISLVNEVRKPFELWYKCWDCAFTNPKYEIYERHRADSHGPQTLAFGCDRCSFTCQNFGVLSEHKLKCVIQPTSYSRKPLAGEATPPLPVLTPHTFTQSPVFHQSFPIRCPTLERQCLNTFTSDSVSRKPGLLKKLELLNVTFFDRYTYEFVDTGKVQLTGGTEAGKSTIILSIMLALGYDRCLADCKEPRSICGLSLKHLIQHGKNEASIQLTVSTNSFPREQRSEYGEFVIIRRCFRNNPNKPDFRMYSATNHSFIKVLEDPADVKKLLRDLNFPPEQMRLMLLDGENVTFFVENVDSWYTYFGKAMEHTLESDSEPRTKDRIKVLKHLVKRLALKEKWVREKWNGYRELARAEHSETCEELRRLKAEDMASFKEVNNELHAIKQETQTLDSELEDLKRKKQLSITVLTRRVVNAFREFLNEFSMTGVVKISPNEEKLGVCICHGPGQAETLASGSVDDLKNIWDTMSIGKKKLAIMGLYIAFWEISNFPVYAADAYSSTETDFSLPPGATAALMKLIHKQGHSGKQFIVSSPTQQD